MSGPGEGSEDIVSVQVRIRFEDVFNRMPRGQLAKDHPDGDAHPPNARLTAHNAGIERDSFYRVHDPDRITESMASYAWNASFGRSRRNCPKVGFASRVKLGEMKAFRFKPELTQSGDLKLPSELRAELVGHEGGLDSVVLFLNDTKEDRDWAGLTAAQFLEGYDEADAVYDALV